MIVINKGESNDIVVTVTEKTTISNPYYLFVFESRQAPNNIVKCIASNRSTVTVRYDEFTIDEKESPNSLAGEIEFPITGEWSYSIYQTANLSLIVPSEINIVERGICKVVGDASTINTYQYEPTIQVYE